MIDVCLQSLARWRAFVLPAWYVIALLASLIAFIYSFVDTYTSSTLDIDAFFAAGPRPIPLDRLRDEPPLGSEGTYNIEAWSCQLRPIFRFRGFPFPGNKCHESVSLMQN